MMTDKIKRIFAAGMMLVASVVAVTVPCSAQSTRRTAMPAKYSYFPTYHNPTPGQIPLIAWTVVSPEFTDSVFLSDEYFDRIHRCGINAITNIVGFDARGERILDQAQRHGLKVFVQQSPKTSDAGRRMAEYFRDKPVVAGYLLQDEPTVKDFADLVKVRNAIYDVDTTRLVYTNLLPIVPGKVTGTDTYLQYMQGSEQALRLPLLSYDHYPVVRKNGKTSTKPEFYENLEYACQVSTENRIPFWAFGLIMGHYSYPVPTVAHLRFQTFNALAYGAQGIQYWRYILSSNADYDATEAPVTMEGQSTRVWDALQTVNSEIQGYAPVFLGCTVRNIGHLGSIPQGAGKLEHLPAPFTKIKPGKKGILVSSIVNEDRHYVVFCNHDVNKKQKVKIGWTGRLRQLMPDGSSRTVKNSSVTLDPGSYAIFTY